MWVCQLTFENGYSSQIEANTTEGIMSAIHDIMFTWKSPVTGLWMAKIRADQIVQGRVDWHVD